jgi:chitinase
VYVHESMCLIIINMKNLSSKQLKGLVAFVLLVCCITINANAQEKNYKVIGYVGAFGRPINVAAIDAKKLTHINYAFVNCKDSVAYLDNAKVDSANFRQLNKLKAINPDLKILISIGGGTRSRFISDAVLTETSRAKFARSAIELIIKFDLDGIDLDWEYPGQLGNNNNVFRPVDKHNFTLMFMEFRKQLDELSLKTKRKYLISGAFNVSKVYTDHVELSEVAKYMDYINLMTYDFSGPNRTVGHHTNLYSYGALHPRSGDKGITDYIKMGVPPEKLLLGVAFYGRGVQASTTNNHGLGEIEEEPQPGVKIPSGGFTKLKDSLINKNGYVRYWDSEAMAPYLFNAANRFFITYDDEQSTKAKAEYVKSHHLAGAFFWEYFEDPEESLLNVLDKELGK